MRRSLSWLIAVQMGVFLATEISEAGIIAEHTGDKQPDGGLDATLWTRTATDKKWEEGPATESLPAWRVSDFGYSTLRYTFVPEDVLRQDASANGWKLSLKLRVNPTSVPADFCTVYGEYADAERKLRYVLSVSYNEKGEPVVLVNAADAPAYTVAGAKATDFHLYELKYDQSAKKAALLVDGNRCLDDIAPLWPNGLTRIQWGSTNTAGVGSGDYNLVRFETDPN